MHQLSQFAQTATYNCSDSPDSTYGAGNFGTCVTNTASTGVGAPDSGTFLGLVTSGGFSILLAVAIALAITIAATIVIVRRKKHLAK